MKKITKREPKSARDGIGKPVALSKNSAPLKACYIPEALKLHLSFLHETLPRFSVAPAVVHSKTEELIYITNGRVTAFMNDKKISLKKGEYLVIPAGTTHQFETENDGMEAVSVLVPPIDPANPDATVMPTQRMPGKKSRTTE
ncbi:MAG: cupin domain-containing protein [Elusimicrobiales bacterium]|jgi:mannose-6-phosphate isomerase-like protein (cupin superfamily)